MLIRTDTHPCVTISILDMRHMAVNSFIINSPERSIFITIGIIEVKINIVKVDVLKSS